MTTNSTLLNTTATTYNGQQFPAPINFPIEHFPAIIRSAVQEVQANTGFPLPLIAVSALGAVAAACQNSINVELPVGSVSPTSLFLLIMAESGEGKTPTDRFFTKPIRDFEENELKKLEEAEPKIKAHRTTWEIQRQGIEKAIKKNSNNALKNNNPETYDLLTKESEKLQKALEDHLSMEPKRQLHYKMFHGDTNPNKILVDLHENWPSAYLCSDEAGSVFRGSALSNRGMINQLWDGATLTVDRISSPSFQVKDARLTISLSVQNDVLDNFLNHRATDFRNIGTLARYLVVYPYSTKGSRILNDRPQFTEYLTAYQQRITEILTLDKQEMDNGRKERHVLKFSAEARKYWLDFRNRVESNLNPGRYLADIDDFASKISTNLARIAALFHYFEGQKGDISWDTVYRAGVICEWFIHEFKRLFSSTPKISLQVADTWELEQFLHRWSQNHPSQTSILKSLITQYGPNSLRTNKDRRNYAINELAQQCKIFEQSVGKKKWITFNPAFFPSASVVSPYQPVMRY